MSFHFGTSFSLASGDQTEVYPRTDNSCFPIVMHSSQMNFSREFFFPPLAYFRVKKGICAQFERNLDVLPPFNLSMIHNDIISIFYTRVGASISWLLISFVNRETECEDLLWSFVEYSDALE